MSVFEFTFQDKEDLFSLLKSRPTGLTKDEVLTLQKTFGFNEVKTQENTLWDVFFKQFKSAFFYLLFAAGVISWLLAQGIESLLIFLFAFLNVFIGFFQEYRAQKAVNALKKYFAKQVKVIRSGETMIIDSKFLVPGDIVMMEAGDMVACDLRIIESNGLMIDESILTGESQPVNKTEDKIIGVKTIFEAKNIAFSGTAIVSGTGKGVVINTGANTELGKMAKLSSNIIRPSIYEKELADFSRLIFITVFLTITLIFFLNLFLKRQPNLIDFIIFCLALIVGLVPEALPVVVSVSLSRGALKLLKKKVVVKRLSSIEDLGNMEVLCTDKTGTLTENRLKIEKIISPKEDELLFYFLLVSPLALREKSTNPLDQTVLEAFSPKNLEKKLFPTQILASFPFDFQRLRSSVLFEKNTGEKILIVRGTADSVIPLCVKTELEDSLENSFQAIKNIESQQGQRVIVLAFKPFNQNSYSLKDENNLTLLGYLSFSDPLKATAPETINLAKKLKVKIKILTGDSKEVAGKIAYDVGLINDVNQVILGSDLDELSEEELSKKCDEFSVFARVSPETKLKIIQTLQKKYEVGFLGEGINDALALKMAHVGIAVKEATEVSRESADILLLDTDLKVIVDGIKEGRVIFANINKYIRCTLSSSFGNFYSIALMSLILPFLPMLPPQILLENILSDTPLITIANDSVDSKELRRPKMYTLSKTFPFILILALISSIFDFIFLAIFHKQPQIVLQTSWFVLSLITEILLIISVRTRHVFFKAAKPSPNLIIACTGVIILTFLLPFISWGQKLFSFTPLPFYSLMIIFGLGVFYLLANELAKAIYFRYH